MDLLILSDVECIFCMHVINHLENSSKATNSNAGEAQQIHLNNIYK